MFHSDSMLFVFSYNYMGLIQTDTNASNVANWLAHGSQYDFNLSSANHLLTPVDGTYIYLINRAGFTLGMDVDEACVYLWKTLFSSEFHYRQFIAKLRETLDQIKATFFCGERPLLFTRFDSKFRKFIRWSNWVMKMVFYHLPLRIFILTGDSPNHDWHHKHPASRDLINLPNVILVVSNPLFRNISRLKLFLLKTTKTQLYLLNEFYNGRLTNITHPRADYFFLSSVSIIQPLSL